MRERRPPPILGFGDPVRELVKQRGLPARVAPGPGAPPLGNVVGIPVPHVLGPGPPIHDAETQGASQSAGGRKTGSVATPAVNRPDRTYGDRIDAKRLEEAPGGGGGSLLVGQERLGDPAGELDRPA